MRVEGTVNAEGSSYDSTSPHKYNQKHSYLRSQKTISSQREIINEIFSSLGINIYEKDECESRFISCEQGVVKKLEVKHFLSIWSTHDTDEQIQISSSIGLLTNLEEIVFDDVPDLGGTLPTELGSLSYLRTLRLVGNTFLGQVPTELGALNNLEWLDLAFNVLTGFIPSELGNLKNIKRLNIGHNLIDGTIPYELGNLDKIEILDLSCNRLTGTIPSDLDALDNLQWFDLYDNSLTGSIPEKLNRLSSLEVINLDPPQPEITLTSNEKESALEATYSQI